MSEKNPKRAPDSPDRLFWEKYYWDQSYKTVAGLDEVGRGCWAGPVVAAAVILKPYTSIPEVDDSKKIKPQKREELFDRISSQALAYAVSFVSVEEIDRINILEASKKAMCQALAQLSVTPDYLLVDGNQGLGVNTPQKLIIKGDSLSISIGAASIIAKVTRDRFMVNLEKEFPQFSFAKHKGYGTALHQKEIEQFGITEYHQKSFAPIKLVLDKG